MKQSIRSAAVAGTFYGAESAMLRRQLQTVELPDPVPGVCACMVPHAGYVFSMPTALRTLAAARGKNFSKAVIIGPSHRSFLTGAAIADFSGWATPFGTVEADTAALNLLKDAPIPELCFDNAPHVQEHSIEVQLPLLQYLFEGIKIVPVLAGQLDLRSAAALGKSLAKLHTPETLWVISGDFTHYGKSFGYTPFGLPVDPQKLNALDREGAVFIANGDIPGLAAFLNKSHATICGINPAVLFLKTMEAAGVSIAGQVTEVTDSGVVSKDFNHIVGYAGIIFTEKEK